MSKKNVFADYAVLVECAEAFQKTGESFIDAIHQRIPGGSSWKPPSGLGELVCCATNLGFGLELYLKALLVRFGKAYPHEHDLSKLYATLPAKVKHSIERKYNEYLKFIPPEVYASITVAKGPKVPPKWSDYAGESQDLASVLNRSRDVFSSWRYLFEVRFEGTDPYEIHQFEYLLLDLACKALRTQARAKLA